MCRIERLFSLHRLKGSMSRDARDFNNVDINHNIKLLGYNEILL